jgi:peptidoglycan hydrolase CwlO-like protein
MEAILTRPVQEGEQEKTCTEIVSQVLSKSSTFLRNVGLQQPTPKSVSPLVQELRSQLDAEKEESAGLRQKLQRLEAQAEESKANAQKQDEETDILKKKMENTENLIKQMIAFG